MTLPARVRALHAREGLRRYRGQAEVTRGSGTVSRFCAWVADLPPAWHGAVDVEIDASDGIEAWTRRFGAHVMRSRLRARSGLLCERLGLMRFGFRLGVDGGAVTWRVERAWALGIPLPRAWFSGVRAREYEADGHYRFEVSAALPAAGLVVAYQGWLHVE